MLSDLAAPECICIILLLQLLSSAVNRHQPRQSGHYRGPSRCCSCPQKLTMSPTIGNGVPAAALHKRGHEQAALASRIAARHRCRQPVPEQGHGQQPCRHKCSCLLQRCRPPLTVALVSMGMGGGICMVGGRGVLEGLTLLT